ncbi:MAG: extracellular solute-binding protein family 1 [Bacteroidetes bacterium]|jgi:multiple sugar transport system substrate-binding protein|nr:extracellular solute-binding protein family 1 [Bacteroidota bacterium]
MKFVSVTVLMLCLIAGCADQGKSPDGGGGAVELTYWPAPNPQEIQLADTLVRRWNALHPECLVRMQPIPVSQSTEEVLLAAIAGGTTPDICSNIQPGALYDFVRARGLLPLDQFPGFDSIALERAGAELLQTFRSPDGHIYQLPWKSNPVMMFYNKRLLREAGIAGPPRTFNEYLAAGRRVTKDTTGDGQTDIWMGERDIRPIWWQRLFDFYPFYIAASSGRTLFANGQLALDERAAAEVLAFFRTCYGEGIYPRTFFQAGDPFLLEMKATHFSGPWEVATIRKFAPTMDYGVAPLPVPDDVTGPVYTYGDFKNIAIFSTSQHPEKAWEFVRYLVRAEHDLLLLQLCDQIPVRTDLVTNPLFAGYFRANPVMAEFGRQLQHIRGIDTAPDLKEIFDTLSQIYEASAVYGSTEPQDAVREIVRRTNIIVEWNR